MKRINFFKKKSFSIYFYPILSAILLSLSYNYLAFWFMGLFALVPLIKFLYQVKNKKELFIGLFIFSFLAYNFLMSWLWSVDIFSWTGISSFWFGKLIIFFYINYFVLLAVVLPFLVSFYLFYKFKTKTFIDVFLFSGLWILMEYLKILLHFIIYFGDESFFGFSNTAISLGYILGTNYNLLQLAQFGGIYLLSFIVVFINFLIYWVFIKNKSNFELRILLLVALIIILFFPLKIFIKKETSEPTKVSILQTKNEPFFTTTYQKEQEKSKIYEKLLAEIEKSNYDPDIIIFPEDSRFTQRLINERKIGYYYQNFFANKDVGMIIDSSRIRDEKNEVKLRLYYYDLKNYSIDKYDKLLLTPGGEYLPNSFKFFARTLGFEDWLKKVDENKYTKGDKVSVGEYGDNKIGGVFCFEIISPEITRKMTQNGANLFVNPASHASFNENQTLRNQILNMTKVRAVENGRYIIQSGNYIPSSIINNKGEVLSNEKESPSVLNGNVYFKKNSTVYSRFGNWLVGFSSFVLLFFLIGKIRKIKT